MREINIVLTRVPSAPLSFLPRIYCVVLESEKERISFFFDEKELCMELILFFKSLEENRKPRKVKQDFKYVEVKTLPTLPEGICYTLIGEGKPPYHCLILDITSSEEEDQAEQYYLCFDEPEWANWLASIIERAHERQMNCFGVG